MPLFRGGGRSASPPDPLDVLAFVVLFLSFLAFSLCLCSWCQCHNVVLGRGVGARGGNLKKKKQARGGWGEALQHPRPSQFYREHPAGGNRKHPGNRKHLPGTKNCPRTKSTIPGRRNTREQKTPFRGQKARSPLVS